MVAISSRLSILALVIYLSSVVAAKPYAPALQARTDIENVKREIGASQPYASELHERSEEDPIQIQKRGEWSSFNTLGQRSKEELHTRGRVADSLIEKRGKCTKDSSCGSNYYCSATKNKCYKKLDSGSNCSRDGVCDSDCCSSSSNKCREKKSIGSKCNGNNTACDSDYCSVKTDLCRAQASKGGQCVVDDGCTGTLSCVNGKCESPSKTSSTSVSKPTGTTSPSVSVNDKRELRSV